MADVATRQRRKRRLLEQKRNENKAFSKFKKCAKYGSKLHRQRISQGVLEHIYGRPLKGKYWKGGSNPRRVAGYNPKKKLAITTYVARRKKKRPLSMR